MYIYDLFLFSLNYFPLQITCTVLLFLTWTRKPPITPLSTLYSTLSPHFIPLFTKRLIHLMQDCYHWMSFSGSVLPRKQSPKLLVQTFLSLHPIHLCSHIPLAPFMHTMLRLPQTTHCSLHVPSDKNHVSLFILFPLLTTYRNPLPPTHQILCL